MIINDEKKLRAALEHAIFSLRSEVLEMDARYPAVYGDSVPELLKKDLDEKREAIVVLEGLYFS